MAYAINGALALYFLAISFYCLDYLFKKRQFGKTAFFCAASGFISQSAGLISRWFLSGHPPLANLYESVLFFSWAVMFMYLILRNFASLRHLGLYLVVFAAVLLGYASTLDKTIKPLMPALRSNWLFIHVSSYFIGYAAAAAAVYPSAIYLFRASRSTAEDGVSVRLDDLSHRLIVLAFPFLTIGITTGSVWAFIAWGRYWGWDPKETWSLITWIIYAVYIHLRFINKNAARAAAILSILGFFAIIFTFLGVGFFLHGMHSYD
ncbi:MAG: c-type cytochrome biogenesis protein CcsB [Candidatus Omnitrophica bacterium]|nr:c-type cytochrome biogenesis protein CcsB [Candidatus Omnitrophota bacterium]